MFFFFSDKNYLNNCQNHFRSVNWMSVMLHSQIPPRLCRPEITKNIFKVLALKAPRRHVCNNFGRFSRHFLADKKSHHVMDASC